MRKAANIKQSQGAKNKSTSDLKHNGFEPCSPDMTICGDCTDNRAKRKCPRLKEWLAKRQE